MSNSYKYQTKTIQDLYDSRLGLNGTIYAMSHYQRPDVFNKEFIDKLLDSLVSGIPIGQIIIHFIKRDSEKRKVFALVDGRQRTGALLQIMNQPLKYNFFSTKIKDFEKNIKTSKDIKSHDREILLIKFRSIKKKFNNRDINEILEIKLPDIIAKSCSNIKNSKQKKFITTNIKNFFEVIKDELSLIISRKVIVCNMTGDDTYILDTFKRINTQGNNVTKTDLIASSWSKHKLIKSRIKNVNTFIKNKKHELLGEFNEIYIDSNDDEKYSVYYYLRSFHDYLCSKKKYSLYNSIKGSPKTKIKENEIYFNTISKIFCLVLGIDNNNIELLPIKLIELYERDELGNLELDITRLLAEFNTNFKSFHEFIKIGNSSLLTLNTFLDFIKLKKLNLNNIRKKIIFGLVINKLKSNMICYDKDISELLIQQIIKNYLVGELDTQNKKPTTLTKAFLFLIYDNDYINIDKTMLAPIFDKKITKNIKNINTCHLTNFILTNERVDSFDDIKKCQFRLPEKFVVFEQIKNDIIIRKMNDNIEEFQIHLINIINKKICDEYFYYFNKKPSVNNIKKNMSIKKIKCD
jgi:hypothetical protein